MKYNSFIILLYFWLHIQKPILKYCDLNFFSHFWRFKTSKITSFQFLKKIGFKFLTKFGQFKKGCVEHRNIAYSSAKFIIWSTFYPSEVRPG